MINIAIFVSGNGSNAENIFTHFLSSPLARVTLLVTDNANAYALQRAEKLRIKHATFTRSKLKEATSVLQLLREHKIDYVVLAGFLSLVPAELVKVYRGRIINIHPALLPAYGGKGMYGDNVHRAVIANREKESGITIHLVDEHYDEGAIIAQYKVTVDPSDTHQSLAQKIHTLEYEHFPKIIEKELEKLLLLQP